MPLPLWSIPTLLSYGTATTMQVEGRKVTDGSVVTLQLDADGNVIVSGMVEVMEGLATEATLDALSDKLPAAAALSDNTANPTTTQIGSFGMVWDGANWDRMRGTLGCLLVAQNGTWSVFQGGTWNIATVSTIGQINAITPGFDTLELGKAEDGNVVGVFGITRRRDTAASGTTTNGLYSGLISDATGRLWVNTELPDAAVISSDSFSAPTTSTIYGLGMAFNGTTWGRIRGDATDGLLVNLGSNNDVTISGTVTVDTELGTAASITGDNVAAPTAPTIYSFGMVFDGSNWDRLRGDSADGLLVNLGANNDVTVSNTVTVSGTVAVSGTVDVNTELPAAGALGDNTANPTVPSIGSFGHVWDGSGWDRTPGTSADGVLVNLGSNNDVTVTGTVTADAGSGTFTVGDGGGSLTIDNPALSVVGGGVEATALRVTIASDSTGVLSVDDNGGSLTVDGTVAATQSGTWNITDVSGTVSLPTGASTSAKQDTIIGHVDGIEALLTTIDGDTGTLAGAVSGTEMQVDIVTMPNVTISGTVTVDTELGAAASITGDNIAAPTAPTIYAFGLVYDGTNWDRLRGDSANGIAVDLGSNNDVEVTNTVDVTGTVSISGTVTVDSELPGASALGDDTANPTLSAISAYGFVYDGSTWDRMRGTSADGVLVNLGSNNDVTITSGTVTTVTTVTAVTAISNALPAGTNILGRVGHDSTGLGHGVTTVTTAGTDVALAGSTAAKWVTVQAQTDNTGLIAVGASGVDATVATGTGQILFPGDSITLPIDNLADVFIDSTVNGEGVRYVYGT